MVLGASPLAGLSRPVSSADFRRVRRTELQGMQMGIEPGFPDQRVVGSAFDHKTGIEDMDHIRMLNGREPVRDDDGRPPLHQNLEGILDLPLRIRIQRAGGLVQQQDWRVLQNGPGPPESLVPCSPITVS